MERVHFRCWGSNTTPSGHGLSVLKQRVIGLKRFSSGRGQGGTGDTLRWDLLDSSLFPERARRVIGPGWTYMKQLKNNNELG